MVAALIAITTILPSTALAQSPSAVPSVAPSVGPSAPTACPALTTAASPIHDPGATLTLAFGAANPDTATGGFHAGEDWAMPGGVAGTPVFAIGDGQVVAAAPAVTGGHGGLVVVAHTGPVQVPASAAGAPFSYPASTEATILTAYAGIDPAMGLAVGACVTGDTQLGTTSAQCSVDVPDPCSDLPPALHLELRLASTEDPANRSADWWVVGPPDASTDGWFHDAQAMVDAGLRDPSAFIAALSGPAPLAGLDKLVGSDGRLTFLLLGSDHFSSSCHNRGSLGGERTDTIMLATINPANGKVSMASLPRDTIDVPIGPGQVYGPKVTGLFQDLTFKAGGKRAKAFAAMVKAMEYLTGVQIDYYGLTYFCGVKDVVDAIGGITVTLTSPLVDPTMHLTSHGLVLKAGKHHLNGKTALAFARSRHSDSDYARARRQQQVIAAVADRIRSLGVKAIPALVGLATAKVDKKLTRFQTDFPLGQVGTLYALLKNARLKTFYSTVLAPPTFETEGTGTQLYSNLPDVAAMRRYFAKAFGPVNQ